MAKKLKRNYIQLVTGTNDKGEPTFDTFLTPHFIPLDVMYEAVDVMEELESIEEKNNKSEKPEPMSKIMRKQMDIMMGVVVNIYGGQFDVKALKAGLHAPNMREELQGQIEFIAAGQQDDETKKFVESLS